MMKCCRMVVFVVPKAVQRALGSDDDLDTLADPCGNSEFRDEITSRFLPPIITTSTPATTTTTAATTTTEFLYYWRNRNNGQDDHIMYPWGAVTTRVDSAWPPQLPTTSIPRELALQAAEAIIVPHRMI